MVEEAAMTAIHSPLLERGIDGATRILVNVTGSYDLSMNDANEILEKVRQATGQEDPDVLFGITPDEAAGDEVRVTVIATGFDDAYETSSGLDSMVRPVRTGSASSYDPKDYDIPAFLRNVGRD